MRATGHRACKCTRRKVHRAVLQMRATGHRARKRTRRKAHRAVLRMRAARPQGGQTHTNKGAQGCASNASGPAIGRANAQEERSTGLRFVITVRVLAEHAASRTRAHRAVLQMRAARPHGARVHGREGARLGGCHHSMQPLWPGILRVCWQGGLLEVG